MAHNIYLCYFFKLHVNLQLNQNKKISKNKPFKDFSLFQIISLDCCNKRIHRSWKMHILPNYLLKKSCLWTFLPSGHYCTIRWSLKMYLKLSPLFLSALHPKNSASLSVGALTTGLSNQSHRVLLVSNQPDYKFLHRINTFLIYVTSNSLHLEAAQEMFTELMKRWTNTI